MPWPFSRREKRSAAGNPLLGIPGPMDVPFAGVGTRINETTALTNVVIWSGTRLIADTISTMPLTAVTDPDDETLPVRVSNQPPLVTDGFAFFDRQAGIFQTVVSMVLAGNAYWQVLERAGLNGAPTYKGLPTGTPTKVAVLHPDRVKVTLKDGVLEYAVNGKVVDPDTIVHIPYFLLPGDHRGLSPIDCQAGGISWALALNEHGVRYFSDGVSMSGIIETPEALDVPKARQLKQSFESRHAGVRNSHAVGVLSGGAKWVPLAGMSNEASQFLESRQWSATELLMMLGVPPHLVGVPGPETFAGTGLSEMTRSFTQFTLNGILRRIENAIGALLPDGMKVRFSVEELTRLDRKSLAEVHQIGIENGWLCADDIRRELGMPPLPDDLGQVFRIFKPPTTAPVTTDDNGEAAPLATADPSKPAPIPTDDGTPPEENAA